MSPTLVSITFFALLCVASLALYSLMFGGTGAIKQQLSDVATQVRVARANLEGSQAESEGLAETVLEWAMRRVPPPKTNTPRGEKLIQSLAEAGFIKSAAPHVFQVVRAGMAIGGMLVAVALALATAASGTQLAAYVGVGSVLGLAGPEYYIGRRARKRKTAVSRELSQALDLLVVCVEAGLGLHEAIRTVGVECERQGQQIGTELALVAAEISAGATLGQAVRSMAERTGVEDIKPLAATLVQSEQLGGRIAPALRASSEALRTRRRLNAEERAQKASIKVLIPLVLFVLPAMILVIIGPALIQVMRTLSR